MNQYQKVKEDLVYALGGVGAKLVHVDDGTDLGDKCFGFVVGWLARAARMWTDVPARQAEVARLSEEAARLRARLAQAFDLVSHARRDLEEPANLETAKAKIDLAREIMNPTTVS